MLLVRMTTEYRRLDYANDGEIRRYLELFYALPAELDEYYVQRSKAYIDSKIAKARQEEDEANTFAGVAVLNGEIVGLHLLRRFEEGNLVGVHVAGLWVAQRQRRRAQAQAVGRSLGALDRSLVSQQQRPRQEREDARGQPADWLRAVQAQLAQAPLTQPLSAAGGAPVGRVPHKNRSPR
jgi:hypothetical protein